MLNIVCVSSAPHNVLTAMRFALFAFFALFMTFADTQRLLHFRPIRSSCLFSARLMSAVSLTLCHFFCTSMIWSFLYNIYCTRLITFFRTYCNQRPAIFTTGWGVFSVVFNYHFFLLIFCASFFISGSAAFSDASFHCSNLYTFCAALICFSFQQNMYWLF